LFLIGPQLGAAKIRKFRSSSLQLYSEISVKTTGLGFRGAAHGFFRQPAKYRVGEPTGILFRAAKVAGSVALMQDLPSTKIYNDLI
jgi:hypothetical protein